MSKQTKNSGSGIKDAMPIAPEPAISQVESDFAMTLSLQKTEWQKMEGVRPVLFSLRTKSGRMIGGVLFVCPTRDIEGDHEAYTFRIGGTNIDDVMLNYATRAVAEAGAIPLAIHPTEAK